MSCGRTCSEEWTDGTDSAHLQAGRTTDRASVIRHCEARVYDNSQTFNLGLKRNRTTTNLEMLTLEDTCPRASTDNQCLSFVVVKFEFVQIHPNRDLFDTRLCLFDKGTKISGKGRTEKLCIVRKLYTVRHDTARYGTTRHGTTRHGTVRHDRTKHGMSRYNAV